MADKVLNVLLLRGLVREQRHWGRFPAVLSEKLPEAQLHFLDLPGIGTERRRPSPFTVSEITEDLRRRWLLLKEQNDKPWLLFSLSLGSMVALDWTARYPEDFRHSLLMNTSAGGLSPLWQRLRFSVIQKLLKIGLEKDGTLKEALVLSLTTSLLDDSQALAAEWSQHMLPPHRMRLLALAQLCAAIRFRAPKNLLIPAQFLAGARDKLVNPRCTEVLAKFYKREIAVHPDAGHDICLDDPEWVAKQYRQSLESFKII
jgi:pimeloyl-ACP methyl ester carboxylesterase